MLVLLETFFAQWIGYRSIKLLPIFVYAGVCLSFICVRFSIIFVQILFALEYEASNDSSKFALAFFVTQLGCIISTDGEMAV